MSARRWLETVVFGDGVGDYRIRKGRGTRLAFDSSEWLTIVRGLLVPLFLPLALGEVFLQSPLLAARIVGGVLVAASLAVVFVFVRWLRRPEDPDSRRALDERPDPARAWRAHRVEGRKRRRRPSQ